VSEVRRRIAAHSEGYGDLTPRDFACTLLFVLADDTTSAFVQVGDGAIVIHREDEYVPVFWPETGEYANCTFFVTDNEAVEHIQYAVDARVDEVGLLTDGLQSLALRYDMRTAHAPFFRPMFQRLRREVDTESPELFEAMREFLDSTAVNARTDDDKTLLLATRVPPPV
jgi:hypothetical protein